MKTLITFALSVFSALALADSVTCRSYGGNPVVLKTSTVQYRFVDMCYFGNSGIELTSLDRYARHQRGVWAVQKYIDNRSYWPKDCFPSGGRLYTAVDSQNRSVMFCEFYDGSIMDAHTFELGVDAPENMRMNSVLGIN